MRASAGLGRTLREDNMGKETTKEKKIWAVCWLVLGFVFVIESIGGAGGAASLGSMFCGFMLARCIADILQPNAH